MIEFKIATWNMRGTSKEFKLNEAQKFISDNKLHVCAIFKTHLKTHNTAKIGDRIFGQ